MASLKVFDTNALIAVSQGTHIVDPLHVRVAISIITRIEMLAWPSLSAADRAGLRQMLAPVDVVDLDRVVEAHAIDIRTSRLLKLPDAIVAASALSLQVPLVTNDNGFLRVPGLRVEKF
jgi:predicted nucleic acid-binding protein